MRRTMSHGRRADRRTGIALVPVILVVSGLAVFTVALLSAVLSGSRTIVHQDEDYRVASAVESVAALAAEGLWSRYVAEEGGAAGDVASFRAYLAGQGIPDAGPGGLPAATDGKDLLGDLGLPVEKGHTRFNDVIVDAVNVVRRDAADATQLFLTVSASTSRGEGLVNPVLNRAVQQVYTVEPADFPGFEYALLANNVNCIFCHTRVDNAERWWNTGELNLSARVKVGTLESLMIRHNGDGLTAMINDYDADSFIAGSLYVRGHLTDGSGNPVTDWAAQSFKAHPFDAAGNIIEDVFGLDTVPFSPAGDPPEPWENLYLAYASEYAAQVDGYLPDHFPSPFADDGGMDPATGVFDGSGAGNKRVDDSEFHDVASGAIGSITAGTVNVTDPGTVIDTLAEYADAVQLGNRDQLVSDGHGVSGNVILTGTEAEPIWIDGTLAIDGDLVIDRKSVV